MLGTPSFEPNIEQLKSRNLNSIVLKLSSFPIDNLHKPFGATNTAIEVLEGKAETVESDIWYFFWYSTYVKKRSFGITMWEMFSSGGNPYKGVSNLISYLKEGNRPGKPHHCDDEYLYQLMLRCWDSDPKKRYHPHLNKPYKVYPSRHFPRD